MDDLYLDTIIDRYRHPTNKGWIEGADYYKTHNPSCGDRFEIAVSYQDGKIVDARWRGEGCAISTISTDCFCEWAIGKTRQQATGYREEDIREQTGIENITPAREKCLFLPLSLHSISQ